jgi:hypothetical protein
MGVRGLWVNISPNAERMRNMQKRKAFFSGRSGEARDGREVGDGRDEAREN